MTFPIDPRRAVLAVCLAPLALHAQITTARLVGVVTDSTGAVVKHASVQITNERTGISRTVETNDDGLFIAVSLQPSNYDVTVSAAGFSASEAKNVTLAVGQELKQDFTLPVAGTEQTVTVDAGSVVALDTSSAKIGANVSSREIENLPINGRQISQLYLLVPGATNAGSGTFDSIRFSGRSNEQNIIRLDGIEATSIIDTSPGNLNGELTSTFRLQQSLEAVQEFRIDSSSYPAEMGTGTGGQISFVTKSGGSKVHGSAFEYLRNDYFDARNTFNARNVPNNTTKFRLNQFGGELGGPILRDKLFGFADYEGLRQIFAAPYTQNTLSNYARSLVPAGNSIAALLAAYPADTIGTVASEAPGTTTFQGQTYANGLGTLAVPVTVIGQNNIREDFGAIRFDYHINDRFLLYARYNRDQGVSSQVQDASLSRFGQVEVPQNGVLALTQVLSPSIFNETKFGFNSVKMRVTGTSGPAPGVDLSRARIAVGTLTNVGALISLSSSFNGVGAPYTAQSYSFIDNFSLVRGNHNMKFGVEVRPLSLYNNQLGGTTYTYNAPQNLTGAPAYVSNGVLVPATTANTPAMIQFYGDLSDLSPFTGLSGNAQVKQAYYIGYAQDEWKATPSLTLSYGLRYEYYSPLHEVRNKDVYFDINAGNIIPRYSGDWFHSSLKNFGPRLALTYAPASLGGKTIVRVGGGIFYGPGQTEDQIQPEANDRVTRTFAASTGKVYPISPQNDVYANYDINSPTLGYQPRAYTSHYTVPERVTTYTASVQQELPGNMQLLVAYVGSTGRNLFLRSITNLITGVTTNANTGTGTAIRQFGGRFAEIDYKTSGGTDQYHALQTSLQRRFAQGLSLGANYTWAKELGTSSGSNEATTAQNPYDFKTEYGRGTFDIRNSLNVTVLYDLPFGKGRRFSMGHMGDRVLGNFQLGGIENFRSGLPIDVLVTRPDIAYVGNAGTSIAGQYFAAPVCTSGGTTATCSATTTAITTAIVNVPGGGNSRNIRRPNVVPGVNPYLKSGKQFLNPAAFSTPAPGTFGNYRRNDLTGPVLSQLDLTLKKSMNFTERVNLQFQADVYNVMNHPNYSNPGNVRLAQNFGTIAAPFATSTAGSNFGAETSTVGNQVGIGANRQIQLSLRANF